MNSEREKYEKQEFDAWYREHRKQERLLNKVQFGELWYEDEEGHWHKIKEVKDRPSDWARTPEEVEEDKKDTRVCPNCERRLPRSEFGSPRIPWHWRAPHYNGLSSWCKKCVAEVASRTTQIKGSPVRTVK